MEGVCGEIPFLAISLPSVCRHWMSLLAGRSQSCYWAANRNCVTHRSLSGDTSNTWRKGEGIPGISVRVEQNLFKVQNRIHHLDNYESLISNLISAVAYWLLVFIPLLPYHPLKPEKRKVRSEAAEFLETGLIWFLAMTFGPVKSACFEGTTLKTNPTSAHGHTSPDVHTAVLFSYCSHLKSSSFKVVIPSSCLLVTTCQNEGYCKIWKKTGNLGRQKPVT